MLTDDCSGLFKSKIRNSFALRRAENGTANVFWSYNRKFQILKLFYMFKRTNERGRQCLQKFPGS